MTYNDALKKRARLAYTGIAKAARDDKPTSAEQQKAKEIYGSNFEDAAHTERMNKNLADLKAQRARGEQLGGEAYMDNPDLVKSRNDALAQKRLELGTGDMTDEEMSQQMSRLSAEKDLAAKQEADAAKDAEYGAISNFYKAKAGFDQAAADAPGNRAKAEADYRASIEAIWPQFEAMAQKNPALYALAQKIPYGTPADEFMHIVSQADRKMAIDSGLAQQKELGRRATNRNIGIGAGIAGGLGVGAGAYGLTGLFPSLRKKRLLRALIALGAGGAAGAGIGIGTTKGLNNYAIQNAYGATKNYLGGVGRALKGGA